MPKKNENPEIENARERSEAAAEAEAKPKPDAKAEAEARAKAEGEPDSAAAPAPETPDPAEQLRAELAAERDRYLRLAAEFDNYRKRTQKEREALYTDAVCDTISRILPVYDNLTRALAAPCTDEAFYKGVEMTMAQFMEVLEKLGVRKIPSVGEKFNPDLHEAVMHVEDDSVGENVVVEEFRAGFMIGDKVIRYSTVKVAN